MMTRAVLILMCVLAGARTASAQTPQTSAEAPVIVTQGEGSVKYPPDRVWVMIAAESRAKSANDAQRANADAMSAVMQKLKGAGLPADAIRTTAYDLQPEFDFANGRQTLRGYVARNTVEVRVDDIPKVGQILELAVGSGATSVSGVRFDLQDRSSAEREALRLAVADARRRADAAASGAGVRVDRILRIEERRSYVGEPRPMMMAMRQEGGGGGQPPITPGELEIKATVTLTAAIK
jgi:uncharacterized protein YggE